MRHSSQRDLVFETVKASKNHLTAPEIYEIVRQTMPNISLGTVYRNLKLLADSTQLEHLQRIDHLVNRQVQLVGKLLGRWTALILLLKL